MTSCSVEGCYNEAKRGGLCWTHVKRRTRKRPLSTPLQERERDSPLKRMALAALKYAEDTERPSQGSPKEEAKRALHTFEQALYRYKLTSGNRLKFFHRDGRPLKTEKA